MADSSKIRIELLGEPALIRQGQRVPLPALLRRLAIDHPLPVRRDDFLTTLYADSDRASARNRFRVALTRARRILPIIELEVRIGFDPARVEVDLDELKKAIQETSHEPAAHDEAAKLFDLLPHLCQTLFPIDAYEWEIEAQDRWSQAAFAALERLADLAERSSDHGTAAAAAESALKHFPQDLGAWRRYLRNMARIGRGSEAEKQLSSARRRARIEQWPFPEELEHWSYGGEDKAELGAELMPGESLSLERCFRRASLAEPQLIIELLGSASFRPEVLRAPQDTLPLLKEALRFSVPHSEARERIQVRVITALSLLENDQEVLEEVEAFLSQPVSPIRRRIALLSASFAHAMQGDLNRAIQRVEEAMGLAEGPNAEYDAHECRAQRATFLMLSGDLGAAEVEFRKVLAFFSTHPLEGNEPDMLSIQGNLGICLAHQQRFEDASKELSRVVGSARAANLDSIIGLYAPVLAWCDPRNHPDIRKLLLDGIRNAYRKSPRRAVVAAAYGARVLQHLQFDPESRLLREAYAHRKSFAAPLNAIENHLFFEVRELPELQTTTLVEYVRSAMKACAQIGKP